MKATAIGYYNKNGYIVCIDGKEVYRAGNSPFDSQGYVAPDDGVGLRKIRSYCNSTTKDIAEENNALFWGIEREEDND